VTRSTIPTGTISSIGGEEVLRRLTIGDPEFCAAITSGQHLVLTDAIDSRSSALVRLGASIAMGVPGPVLSQRIEELLGTGVDFDQVVAALIALVPTIGLERTVGIAPGVALGLGYDLDPVLEGPT